MEVYLCGSGDLLPRHTLPCASCKLARARQPGKNESSMMNNGFSFGISMVQVLNLTDEYESDEFDDDDYWAALSRNTKCRSSELGKLGHGET